MGETQQKNKEKMNKLQRSDKQTVDIKYFDEISITDVETFVIDKLNFEEIHDTKNITKDIIISKIYSNQQSLSIQNKYLDIKADLSKNNIRKMISTIFDSNDKDNMSYRIKKELISNIVPIFFNSVPICTHSELKHKHLFDKQIIYRFASVVQVYNTDYFTMITAKGNNNEVNITNISIYDFRSKKALDRIPYTPERCTHSQEHTYMINDLTEFVNSNLKKYCS